MITARGRPLWRTLDVPRKLPLYQLPPGFLHAVEPSGAFLEQDTVARMGNLRFKQLGDEPQVVVDILIEGVTFFVLVRDISERMKALNAATLRSAQYRQVSVEPIYDALRSYSFGPWEDT